MNSRFSEYFTECVQLNFIIFGYQECADVLFIEKKKLYLDPFIRLQFFFFAKLDSFKERCRIQFMPKMVKESNQWKKNFICSCEHIHIKHKSRLLGKRI